MKFKNAALTIACTAISAAASAGTADIKASNNQVTIQAISTDVDYTEKGNGMFGTPTGTLDTEGGDVGGAALAVSVMRDIWLGNDYFEAQYSRNSGHTTYTGQSVFGGGGFGSIVRQSSAVLTDYNLRYGKGFVVNDSVMLTPYGEVGRHEWERGVNEGETYTNDWYGIGLMGQYSPAARWALTGNLLIGRTSSSDISVAGPLGFSGSLGNSTLYRFGVGVDYAFTQHFHGNVGVDYAKFKYGISGLHIVGGGGFIAWEPDSETNYTIYRIGLGYAF